MLVQLDLTKNYSTAITWNFWIYQSIMPIFINNLLNETHAQYKTCYYKYIIITVIWWR